jgi:hypothetical protein
VTSVGLVMPLLVALVVAAAVTSVHCSLPPHLSARLLAASLLVVFATATVTVWSVAITWLWHIPTVHAALGWCPAPFGHHHPVSIRFGLPAAGLAVFSALRGVGVVRSHLRLCRHEQCPLHVAEAAEAFAVTLPGRGGQMVVSTGLLRMLNARERAVVLAHESAHAYCRHDRYQLLARVVDRSLPVLRPMASRLQFSLERWADEYAVGTCGDRRLVAATLGKVALTSAATSGVLAFGGGAVSARVKALLAPPQSSPGNLFGSALAAAVVSITLLAAYQVHHLVELLRAICVH